MQGYYLAGKEVYVFSEGHLLSSHSSLAPETGMDPSGLLTASLIFHAMTSIVFLFSCMQIICSSPLTSYQVTLDILTLYSSSFYINCDVIF